MQDKIELDPLGSQNTDPKKPHVDFHLLWEKLQQFGMRGYLLRISTVFLTFIMVTLVVLVMSRFYSTQQGVASSEYVIQSTSEPMPTLVPVLPQFDMALGLHEKQQINKEAGIHTILPSRGRTEMISYVIQPGDSLFSIAEKFGLKPETILWGNRYTLGEDPHIIYPGQELNILPLDGVLHMWSAGEGLNGVAEFYKVTPEDIINYPPNGLSMSTIGDFALPNIPPGKMLIIPGGEGVFTDWRTPRITRDNPATAKYVGPGACVGSYDGVSGSLTFIWPTVNRFLSGYDYSPSTNHYGIDIDGDLGSPIFAADHGVVVYAGWNDWGYGEMIVIDHGAGWQTLYAHLSVVGVSCGQSVYQGDTIGLMGSTGNSTGPHLHFEMRHDEYGRVNPWDFLQ